MTSFFVYPGKNYSFILVDSGKVRVEPFATIGIVREYGLLASDIAAIAILGFFFKDILNAILYKRNSMFAKVWRISSVKVVTICWTIYFFFSLFSSLQYSFNPIFSVINLLQLMKIWIMFICVVYILVLYKSGAKYLHAVISGILILESLFGMYQFTLGFFQLTQITSSATFYRSVEDAATLLPRPWGTLSYANEYALFLLMFGLCFLTFMRNQKEKKISALIVLFIFFGIILSQSRTVIGIVILSGAGFTFFQWQWVKRNIFEQINKKILLKTSIVFVVAFVFIILPRIYSLQYTFDGGGASVRIEMISEGVEVLQEKILTGYGVYTTEKVLFERFPQGYFRDFPFAVHLGYLQFALESGIVATFFFFLPFFLDLRFSVTHFLKNQRQISILISSVMSASVLVYYVFQPHGGILEVPFLGLFLGISLYNYHPALDI